ncbi:MAG: hypothetical protein E7292_05455 [Lachnospiraceae bacterium]|nr:hypothetical protein [Lachnospiraceae bacterium]
MENMPLIMQSFILVLLLYGLPVTVGGSLSSMAREHGNGGRYSLPFLWISGQMILWAVFQLVCVPFVLLEKEFQQVVTVFAGVSAFLMVVGIVMFWRDRKSGFGVVTPGAVQVNCQWIVFGVLFVFQLVQAVRLAYGDGDDAYYVAVSTITEDAETMYRKLPYTGGSAEVDIRHGLAPFPIWIAFLARISGMKAVSVAHVAMPLMLIPMTYGIFYLLGKKLFIKRKKLLAPFMIMTEILVLFGDYSMYTMEHFMLARSRQGKAALGSIVLPMLLFMMLMLLDRLQEKKKLSVAYWGLLCSVMLTGCLCSTMGAFLLCLMVAITGLCAALTYRNWKVLIPMALCCIPCVCYMLLYVVS